MKILIDNGHGRATAGKRSPVWPDGKQLFEYEFNRDIARRMHEALTARGTDSVPVVPEIDDIPLAERTRRVNEIAAQVGPENCLLVSIHVNAGGGTGWEAWTSVGETEADNYATIFTKKPPVHFPNRGCVWTRRTATRTKRRIFICSDIRPARPLSPRISLWTRRPIAG